ncbi:VWA domain-containing protein [Candidatus Gracilibacteria bacterium]|nr:VWA domain-containing protein [Candidatus Gracilibacteria bacterium]
MKTFTYIMTFLTLIFVLSSCGIDIQDGNDKVKIGLNGINIESKDGEKVDIGLGGINIEDGRENVKIGLDGLNVEGKDGEKVKVGLDGINIHDKDEKVKVKVGLNGINIQSKDGTVSIKNSLASIALTGNTNENPTEISFSDEDKAQYKELVNETFEVQSCQTQFDQLVKTFGNSYDSCFAERKLPTHCSAGQNLQAPKVNVAIIFDDSGSMGAKIGNERMIDIAKEEFSNYLDDIDGNIGGGVFVYGHKGSSMQGDMQKSCNGIENIGTLANKSAIKNTISGLQPTGWTPIDASLQKAKKYLDSISGKNDQKLIVLISDGKETCGGNPVATAQRIASSSNTYIDVIGFNVYGDTQKELQKIAKNGGGQYKNVRSRADFQKVFADMKNFTQEIQCGASQAAMQLRQAADTINTYYQCMTLLKEEKVKIMTHITSECKGDIRNLMESREEKIEKKLEQIKKYGEKQLGSFDDAIQKVIQKF